MRKKIILSANTSWYLYNFRLSTIRRLINDGHQVTVIAPRDEYSHKLINLDLKFIELNFKSNNKNPLSSVFLLLRFLIIFRIHDPDIIFNFTIKNNILASLAAFFSKAEVVNNISGLGTTFINNNFITIIIKLLYKFSQKRANIVFCQNNDDMTFIKKLNLVSPNKLKLLPGSGVDLDYFIPQEKKYSYGKTFLYLGRLIYEKGLIELTEAFDHLIKKHNDAKLIICGSYDSSDPRCIEKERIEYWRKSRNIFLINHTDDPKKIFAKADFVILPSYREGMPRSLLEASAMGIPTLASNVPGCREAVIDGVTGLLFNPKDSLDTLKIMEKIISLDNHTKYEMSLKAREHMINNFDEKLVVNAYLNIVNSGEF